MLALAFAFGATLVVTPLLAREENPSVLKKALDMPCDPPCTLCHQSLKGGTETLHREGFWVELEAQANWDRTPEGLPAALKRAEEHGLDSDDDGVSDVLELRLGQSPEEAGPATLCAGSDTPVYGCGARIAPAHAPSSSAMVASLLAVALAAGRRGRSARAALGGRADQRRRS